MTAREQIEALVKQIHELDNRRALSVDETDKHTMELGYAVVQSEEALTTVLSELEAVKAREETYTEFWWLIEGQDGGPLYWKGDVDENPWTRDANKAVRFPDFKSANNVILMYRLNRGNNNEYIRYTHDIKAIEHGFIYGRPAQGGEP